jgi:preprotein translocase subunit SecY
MVQTILNAFTVQEIRKKLIFTAGILALYRLGAYIPSPGVDAQAIKDGVNNVGGSNILGFLNLFSGGSLSALPVRAGDHAVHHGVDHPAAPDGGRALPGAPPEGG